ncbi:MAG: Gfo/Idh/MocA family oxidoreductase [Clostridiaceae bacterium]|nr:Gfo/Idh/MocA family oxidoreductase [Clostridiaceae bacterium]
MKVCFYGNTGHALTAFFAKEKLTNLRYSACCPSFPGESLEKLHKTSNKYGITLTQYSSLDEMLDSEKPDILVVDNRFAERYPVEKKALLAGIHVYADKPIATNLSELNDLYKTAKETGSQLWAMHTTRYEPHYYTVRQLIQEGAIGRVRMVNCQKSYRLGIRPNFYKERKTYGGTILWVSIHAIDMIRMVTGKECLSVYSAQSSAHNLGNGEMEIITTSTFELEDDILATVSTDYYRPSNAHSHDDDRLRVVGTEGIIEAARRDGEHEVRLINSSNNGFTPVELLKPPMLFEDFVHTIEGRGSGIFSMDETFINAYTAIHSQESADKKAIVYLKQPSGFSI